MDPDPSSRATPIAQRATSDELTLQQAYASLKGGLRELVQRDPMDATLVTVLGGAFLFYLAEKDVNPQVRSYWDALVFASTCMSVGYAKVYAQTQAGKAIASALMTVGPAMTSVIFKAPDAAQPSYQQADPRMLRIQEVIAGKLDDLLGELRTARH